MAGPNWPDNGASWQRRREDLLPQQTLIHGLFRLMTFSSQIPSTIFFYITSTKLVSEVVTQSTVLSELEVHFGIIGTNV